MSGEPEPRRSVRATKGQHTKSFDEIEPTTLPKRRQTKKTKKAKEQEQEEEPEEEIIRCVCGASEQDEDSGEAWIACETCGAWQHNVCVGVSSFDDEIPDFYWCEQCRPEDHKELLDGIAKGEKVWEERRRIHEENSKKKGRGRKGRGKRASSSKEELDKPSAAKAKASPAPDVKEKEKKETTAKGGKRKLREDSHDVDGKSTKLRRVSENEAVPVRPSYTPPEDLAKAISELPQPRQGPAKALLKALTHALTAMHKKGDLALEEGVKVEKKAETYTLQIERAVSDTHPATKGQKEYNQQIKTLSFNIKNNAELSTGLVSGLLTPSALAVMSSEQLASSEQQRQTAELQAKVDKQAILYTAEPTGPRIRRTHKGDELVEEESFTANNNEPPPPVQPPTAISRRQSAVKNEDEGQGDQSPSNANFDITKVFSSVKSPTTTTGAHRRPSAPIATNGPGIDPDVDRLLEDENESPPYSPTEDSLDPDVIWRGSLAMASIADFEATAKYAGGANFAKLGSWFKLIPKRMSVAGRIQEKSAIEYLCGLRYSSITDIIVINLQPASPAAQPEFLALIDYFLSKKRYGVIGDKVVGNVRDTYLVPIPAGEDNHPEFMLNLVDNQIPRVRAEPMLVAVFVYRNDADQLKPRKDSADADESEQIAHNTPTPAGHGPGQRSNSASGSGSGSGGPAFSPATPQGSFTPGPQAYNNGHHPQTPVPIPQPPHTTRPPPPPPPPQPTPTPLPLPANMTEEQKQAAQQAGETLARQVLGPLMSVPTAQFILPQAFQMSRREWEVIRDTYNRDPRAREDLKHLGVLLEARGAEANAQQK